VRQVERSIDVKKKVRQVEILRICCSVLQCGAVCCSVLQCVAVCCSVLQCEAAASRIHLSMASAHFWGGGTQVRRVNILCQRVAVCCSVLQYVAAASTV